MKRHVDAVLTLPMIRRRRLPERQLDTCLLDITVLSMTHGAVFVVQSRTMVNLIDCLLLVVSCPLLLLLQPGESLSLFILLLSRMPETFRHLSPLIDC